MEQGNQIKFELINRIAKKTHHTDTLEWLTFSSFCLNDLQAFESKFEGVEQTTLFRIINVLTPEEALAIPMAALVAIASRGYDLSSESKLNVNQCRFAYRILFADERRYGTPNSENVNGDVLIAMNFGNKAEIKHAQSMHSRKFSHPTYPKACEKMKSIAAKYLDSMKDENYPTKNEWYINLPLYRSIWHSRLMLNDIAKSGLVVDNACPDVVCFNDIFEARESCSIANNAANYHKYHVTKTDLGFVLRPIAQYRICGKVMYLNDQLSWSVKDAENHNQSEQFDSLNDALSFIAGETISLPNDQVDPRLLLSMAIKNNVINFRL